MLRLKLTCAGRASVVTLPEAATIADLRTAAATAFSLSDTSCVSLAAGFPPRTLNGDGIASLRANGVQSGSVIAVSETAASRASPVPLAEPAAQALSTTLVFAPHATNVYSASTALPGVLTTTTAREEIPTSIAAAAPASWPCPACTLINSAAAMLCNACGGARPLPPVVEVSEVPADNSCLFSSVGYLVSSGSNRSGASSQRRACAEYVSSHADRFNDVMLGRPHAEYCAFIRNGSSWGGGIELSAFADIHRVEFVAIDVKTCRSMSFRREAGAADKTAFVVFSGIHYDPVHARNARTGEITTLFDASEAAEVHAAALVLARDLSARRQFTDTATFTLKCGVCGDGIKGEAEAMAHAEKTGHQQFNEY